MIPIEGSKVAYNGPGPQGIGDEGTVVSSDVDSGVCHVLWSTGSREQQIDAVYGEDLLLRVAEAASIHDQLSDSLDVSSEGFSVRATYDDQDGLAVVGSLLDEGHLERYRGVAEEAVASLSRQIRSDAAIQALASELDDDESERVYHLASIALIRGALDDEGSYDD